MIIYDMKCENGHSFEGWFKDRQTWIEQNAQKLVICPVCSSSSVEIVPSSLTFVGKESRSERRNADQTISPAQAMQSLYHYIDKNFEDVGNRFAEVALRIHGGDEEKRNIRGTTTPRDEENLKEEGVQFIKISLPKMDS